MRLIACSFHILNANQGRWVKGQHTGPGLAVHFKDVLDHFELSDGRLLGITTYIASSNYWMTRVLQSTLEASGIEWPALRNHIP